MLCFILRPPCNRRRPYGLFLVSRFDIYTTRRLRMRHGRKWLLGCCCSTRQLFSFHLKTHDADTTIMTTQVASSLLSSSDSSMPHLHDHLNNNAHASCSTSSLSSPSVPSTPTVIHSDTNATGSTSASATPRPVRGIKRRLPDHPTPLTERLSSGDVHQQRNSPSSSASASPRKRQGRSSTPPIRSASRRGSARRSLQEFKAESSQSASSSSKSAATLDAGGGNADDQDQQPEKSQEELREEQMFQNWKEEYFESKWMP